LDIRTVLFADDFEVAMGLVEIFGPEEVIRASILIYDHIVEGKIDLPTSKSFFKLVAALLASKYV
jgi:hypothetical protein